MKLGCLALFAAFVLQAATGPERYVRAEENENHELIITTSAGKQIVLKKSSEERNGDKQDSFGQIGISQDGRAVGWVDYYPNCCTSYPIPILVETYRAGKRQSFDPSIAPWHWCFVDGSEKIAAVSTTVHGPQHAVLELWDVASGKRREDFTWMEDGKYPNAPAWTVALKTEYDKDPSQRTHVCSTKK